MGFCRDMVFAALFGATMGFDAFLLAFKIPNFFRRLFAEGAFSQAFVPILAEYTQTKDTQEVQVLVNKVTGNLTIVLMLVTLVGIIGAPFFVMIFAPGFVDEPDRFSLATQMLRITFPYLLFISLTALAGGILNTYQKFAIPAFTPVLLNVSLIFSAIFLSQYTQEPVTALAWGVFIGGFVQLCLQFPFLRRIKIWPKLLIDWKDEGVKRILKLMLPAIVGASVMQINLLVDTLFASFLPVGSLSWLYYADRITELPLGVFGVALATVALPNLSAQFAKKDEGAFNNQLQWALKMCLLVGVPAAIGLIILAKPILATLFYRGAFSANDVEMASRSLMMLSAGLVAFMVVKVMVSAFYARQNTRFPVKVAIIALSCNIVFNALLITPMAHAGLSLASSLSAMIQVLLLGVALYKQGNFAAGGWGAFLFRLLFASSLMLGVLVWGVPELDVWLDLNAWHRAAQLLVTIGMAMAVYAASLWLSGMKVRQIMVGS